jgi:hypothetical protein
MYSLLSQRVGAIYFVKTQTGSTSNNLQFDIVVSVNTDILEIGTNVYLKGYRLPDDDNTGFTSTSTPISSFELQ